MSGTRGARKWSLLVLACATILHSVHVPVHLLTESHVFDLLAHHDVSEPVKEGIDGEDHGDSHDPHSIYDHRTAVALVQSSRWGLTWLPVAVYNDPSPECEQSVETYLPPVAAIELRTIPPPLPKQPRAPPIT